MEAQWVKVDQYNQVKADRHNDKYSILLGSLGQNDVVYPKYCVPQVWRGGRKRVLIKDNEIVFVPWGISLGDKKEQALQIWEAIRCQIEKL